VALGDVDGVVMLTADGAVVVPGEVEESEDEVEVVSDDVEVVSDDVEVVSDDVAVVSDDVGVSDDDVEVSDGDVVDVVELAELLLVSVDALLIDEGSPDAPVPAVEPVPPVFEEVRTVDDAGGDPQSELCALAAGAWMAKAPNAMSATPKSPSPIATPKAAGLRSSALTVQPRIS
jgi:hypothetical protein